MSRPDSTELEQIQKTAEMFEMILQSSPGAIENYESLKDAYRKLQKPEKVKNTYLRLVDYYVQCRELEAAKVELETAIGEFPDDTEMAGKMADLGFTGPADSAPGPAQGFLENMADYEDLCIHCEDLRVRQRLVEHEIEEAKSALHEAREAEKNDASEEIAEEGEKAAKNKIELLQSSSVRRAIRRNSSAYNEIKVVYEDRIKQNVNEHAAYLQKAFKATGRILRELDSEYSNVLRESDFDIEELSSEDIERTKREEAEGARERYFERIKKAVQTAEKEICEKEKLYGEILNGLNTAEEEKTLAESMLKKIVRTLPTDEQAEREAELLSLADELEIISITEESIPEMGFSGHLQGSHQDDLERCLEEEEPDFDAKKEDVSEAGKTENGPQAVPDDEAIELIPPAECAPSDARGFAVRDEKALENARDFGEHLVKHGIITEKKLEESMKVFENGSIGFSAVIIEQGYASEAEVVNCLSMVTGMPYLPLSSYEINIKAAKLLPRKIARKYGVIPVDMISNSLLIVIAIPLNDAMMEELESCVRNMKMSYFVSSPLEVESMLKELYSL